MTYRNPDDALHARNEALQRELDEARREIEELRRGPTDGAPATPRTLCAPAPPLFGGLALAFALIAMRFALWFAVPWHCYGAAYRPPDPSLSSNKNDFPAVTFAGTTDRTGTVSRASTAADVTSGTACNVTVAPASEGQYNCRVQVACGGRMYYGREGEGYARCEVAYGVPVRAIDPLGTLGDGDPMLDMDLSAGRITVEDGRPGGVMVTVDLDPVPATR